MPTELKKGFRSRFWLISGLGWLLLIVAGQIRLSLNLDVCFQKLPVKPEDNCSGPTCIHTLQFFTQITQNNCQVTANVVIYIILLLSLVLLILGVIFWKSQRKSSKIAIIIAISLSLIIWIADSVI